MRERTTDEIDREVRALAGRGLLVAGQYLADQIRRVLSVPAPYRVVTAGPRSRTPGVKSYRALTPATPGAPPRKVSGQLRRSVAAWEAAPGVVRVGVQRLVYARPLETRMGHPYLVPTLLANLDAVGRIVGREIAGGRGNV